MGVTLDLPQDRFPIGVSVLPDHMVQWMELNVGRRGEAWGASWTWSCWCWRLSFTDPSMAILFKLTWM
jgi:hypothetical protein